MRPIAGSIVSRILPAHYLNGFAYPDGKFRFKPDWPNVPFTRRQVIYGASQAIPSLPDHWDVIEEADTEHPFRLATSPARGFLNSTFTETPTSLAREQRPTVMIHPEDAAKFDIADGEVEARQSPRRRALACRAVRRRAPRRADRRIAVAEFGLCRRAEASTR